MFALILRVLTLAPKGKNKHLQIKMSIKEMTSKMYQCRPLPKKNAWRETLLTENISLQTQRVDIYYRSPELISDRQSWNKTKCEVRNKVSVRLTGKKKV